MSVILCFGISLQLPLFPSIEGKKKIKPAEFPVPEALFTKVPPGDPLPGLVCSLFSLYFPKLGCSIPLR